VSPVSTSVGMCLSHSARICPIASIAVNHCGKR
jgi:hypothetical protein